MNNPIVYIVVPCYNEEDCLNETTRQISKKISSLITGKKISARSRIVYIDDGSSDKTWQMIRSYDNPVIGIKLSRNRGHQNALLAGLMYAKEYADIAISMDADLQDDIDAIDKMIEHYEAGSEIVYGVRNNRKTDSFFKRTTAQAFYKLMSLLGVETVYNAADFRLMSKRALDELSKYEESNLFLRGLIPLIGLKFSTVEYSRAKRFAGKSKYPLKKMFHLAWDGITSFSIKPLRLVLFLGILISIVSVVVMVYSLIVKLLGNTVDGWAFLVCSIWLVGGLQMLSIGVLGEYIGKIYTETKRRPKYFIEDIHEIKK